MSTTDDEPWSFRTQLLLWRPCLSRLSSLALIAQSPSIQLEPLNPVIAHGERQIDGIRRRVLCG
ncbi:MAG: hypothetical protein KFB96_02800 [Thiocapsa sp.]|nr:MAG: hypothetical protein KFB96_02800 [Thiocapsa sp.]